MAGLFTEGEIASDPGTIFDYEASLSESLGATFQRQMDTNPLQFLLREADFVGERLRAFADPDLLVDQATAQEEVRGRGLDLKIPVGGITRKELDTLQFLKQREIAQNTAISRRSGALTTALGFGAGLAAGATDPINFASAFIPVIPEARYAAWLRNAGASTAARAAVRAKAGAIEGAAGAALVEPIVYAGATSEQLDYGLMDSFLNVTFGTVLGGGLHTVGGAVSDFRVSRALRPFSDGLAASAAMRDAIANAPDHVKMEAFQSAVRAVEDGAPVDVTPIAAAHADRVQAKAADEITQIKAAVEQLRNDATLDPTVKATQLDALQARAEGLHPRAVQTFTTAKGSTYEVHEDGTTTRNKAFRPEHGAAEQGMQPRTERTVYLTPEQASALATPQGEWRMFAHEDGTVSLISPNKSGGWGVSPSAKNIPVATSPEKGLIPLELWRSDSEVTGPKGTAYRRVHFGNEITETRANPPRNLAGLIDQSRADRTQDAFNRQFVDEADEAASRQADEAVAKSEDAETVAEDTAFLDQQIQGLKSRELWTKADEAALEAGEAKASELERAASIYKAAAVCMAE